MRDSLRRKSSFVLPMAAQEEKGEEFVSMDHVANIEPDAVAHEAPLSLSPSLGEAQVQSAKPRTKSKTRKALADILRWGNISHAKAKTSVPAFTISAPQQLRSPVPPPCLGPDALPVPAREPIRETRVLVKKPSSRRIQTKASQSGLSSLGSIQGSDSTSSCRPSMGPDPFRRPDHGVQVVDSVTRLVVNPKPMPSRSVAVEKDKEKHAASGAGASGTFSDSDSRSKAVATSRWAPTSLYVD